MNRFLYLLARAGIGLIQALPIHWVARIGRGGGALMFWLDRRHRRMALHNLTRCFGAEKSPAEIRQLARENFRRLGENYCSAIKTAAMDESELRKVLAIRGAEALVAGHTGGRLRNRLLATGHFGNFEMFTRLAAFVPGYRCAATYRGIRPPLVDKLIYMMRTISGNLMFERRTGVAELKQVMDQGGVLLSLAVDQSAKHNALEVDFLGHACLMTRSPAIMAMRYDCVLFAPICYRVGLAHWVIEIGEPIPTRENGQRRSADDITRDINRAFETAVRRDPANWFWVHNRWKTRAAITGSATPSASSSDSDHQRSSATVR
jgi:lauroyl/myristoyl acyltransferase